MVDLGHRDYRRDEFKELTQALGRMLLIWNDLQVALGGIFWALTRIPNGLIPGAIWHSLKSDRAQRDMTRDLARLNAIGHVVPPPLQESITWLCGRLDALENHRNHLAHTPFVVSEGRIMVLHLGQHVRGSQIKDKDPIAYCEWFYDYAAALRDYATALESALRGPDHSPPPKPRLPTEP